MDFEKIQDNSFQDIMSMDAACGCVCKGIDASSTGVENVATNTKNIGSCIS